MKALSKKQKEQYLNLIEEERKAYVHSDAGRLAGAMNAEYWDEESGKYFIFHPMPELNQELGETGDPYDLKIEELALLTTLKKRIERMQTYSYMDLYPVFPSDKKRLDFLSHIKTKLDLGMTPSEEEIRTLVQNHEAFMRDKTEDPVKVIMH